MRPPGERRRGGGPGRADQTQMELRLSEVLGALSHALDITEGQPRGHAERSCLIGMRLAAQIGLDERARSSLFYALLLKDAGCSSNAAKVAALYGHDDAAVKHDRKVTDHLRRRQSLRHVLRNSAPGASPLARLRHFKALVDHGSEGARALTALRCDRGADVAAKIGLGGEAVAAIRALDEHWDGRGYPAGAAGEDIPLLGRILCLAQTAEVFWQLGGPAAACAVARERSGSWFDPSLAGALCSLEDDRAFWADLARPDVSSWEPPDRVATVDDARLDDIAAAFAAVVDAKSPYTGSHSEGVARIAVALSRLLGLDPAERRELHRAGLLHDIGKLGVSNRILDKPGKLEPEEWQVMREHPKTSFEILARVRALHRVASLAAVHHERLDGSGYYVGLTAEQLDLPSRVLAVADVAEALSAKRPYRDALAPDEVLAIMRRDAGRALDARVFDALEGWLGAGELAAAA